MATECAYCGFSEAEGAVIMASGLCESCEADPPQCDDERHEPFCDCAAGLCD